MRQLAEQIEAELRALGTARCAAQEKRYLKSELEHLVVTVPAMRKVVVAIKRERPGLTREEVLRLACSLWKKPIHERRAAAVEVLGLYKDRLQPEDIVCIESFLREAAGWALVDNLAAAVAGDLMDRFPVELGPILDRWAEDDNFWLRRSALLALLIPLRGGRGDFPRFCRYADPMLEEKEFFIRKAIGWVLRETAKKTPQRMVDWLLPRAARASGLTLREASKPLPVADKNRLLQARGRGIPRVPHGRLR